MPKPFLKWVGGKRKIVPQIKKLMPEEFDIYFEPFVGGGALFFDLLPKKAILSDRNAELVNCYICLRDHPNIVINYLKDHAQAYSDRQNPDAKKKYYADLRDLDRDPNVWAAASPCYRAARFIFLNKTCFNGLWRVNSRGQNNVPMGDYKNPVICDRKNLLACSETLQGIQIFHASFGDILPAVGTHDFVYLDPPYVPVSLSSNFTTYTPEGFNEQQQLLLCNAIAKIKGYWVTSNSNTEWVRSHYSQYQLIEVYRSGTINSNLDKRNKVKELLITTKNHEI